MLVAGQLGAAAVAEDEAQIRPHGEDFPERIRDEVHVRVVLQFDDRFRVAPAFLAVGERHHVQREVLAALDGEQVELVRPPGRGPAHALAGVDGDGRQGTGPLAQTAREGALLEGLGGIVGADGSDELLAEPFWKVVGHA